MTFYSDSVASALAAARLALGEDTVLVEAGSSPPEDAARGPYRVVAASTEDRKTPGPAAGSTAEGGVQLEAGWPAGLRAELRSLRSSLDAVGAIAARSALERSAVAHMPELAPWIQRLTGIDVPAALVQSVAEGTARRLKIEPGVRMSFPEPLVRRSIAAELESRISARPGIGREGQRCKVTALVGPPGAGKTTTLAKLAMREGVSGRQSAILLSVDVFRIGAADQLRHLASILGVPFRLCETPGALRRALSETKDRDVVLIDTPGASRAEVEWWEDWVPRLADDPIIETQLVLPLTASARQLAVWAERFMVTQPSRLILTHLDEAASLGGMLAVTHQIQHPISYLAAGQGIPEDLEPAAKPRLLELLLGEAGALGAAA